MLWKEIGIIFLLLLGVVIFGNLWFHFVESVLGKIKSLFLRRQKPPAWHPPPEDTDHPNDDCHT